MNPLASTIQAVSMGVPALGLLMPMFLWITADGRIAAAGPTLQKVIGAPLVGQAFLEAFRMKRPRVEELADLAALPGQRIQLCAQAMPHRSLRGVAVPLEAGQAGILLNLSFGIGIGDAVREHALTESDFAATDLAVEMLYLIEAKAAVAKENQALNQRLQGARDLAEAEALTDTLTGLGNRRAMGRAMDAAIAEGRPFGLLHMDLDFFKEVNDTYGHPAGDHVLREVAAILRAHTRETDCVTRFGGDEFVVLLGGLTRPARLIRVARRILAAVREPIDYEGKPCRISVSIGTVASQDYAVPEAARILRDADAALYASKRAGRSRIVRHRDILAEDLAGPDGMPSAQAADRARPRTAGECA